MFKLILKDLMLLKPSLKWQIPFWLFFMFSTGGFGEMFVVISLMLISGPVSIDEKSQTESFFVSLPVKRSTIVIAKYVYMLLVIAFVVAVTHWASQLFHLLLPASFGRVISIKSLLAAQLVVMLFMLSIYPIIFRYGFRLEMGIKMVMLSVLVIFGSFVSLYLILSNLGIDPLEVKLEYNYLGMGVLMLISCMISLAIYKRREF